MPGLSMQFVKELNAGNVDSYLLLETTSAKCSPSSASIAAD